MTPEEINKLNSKNKKYKTPKRILFCNKCDRSREVDNNTNICPVCKSQLQSCNVKNKRFTSPTQHQPQPNIPRCPTCGSTNIKMISSLNRAVHGYAFGLFSKTARSQFCCQNCSYKW